MNPVVSGFKNTFVIRNNVDANHSRGTLYNWVFLTLLKIIILSQISHDLQYNNRSFMLLIKIKIFIFHLSHIPTVHQKDKVNSGIHCMYLLGGYKVHLPPLPSRRDFQTVQTTSGRTLRLSPPPAQQHSK